MCIRDRFPIAPNFPSETHALGCSAGVEVPEFPEDDPPDVVPLCPLDPEL